MTPNNDLLEQLDRHLASPNLAWLLGAGIGPYEIWEMKLERYIENVTNISWNNDAQQLDARCCEA